MPFYRARFTAAILGGGTEATITNIPRQMICVSIRGGGVDATPNPINNDEIELDITFDGTRKLTDASTVASSLVGDGRQDVPLRRPEPVNNSINVALVNNGAANLGVYDVVFECVDPDEA
jgi:hypothetical protein